MEKEKTTDEPSFAKKRAAARDEKKWEQAERILSTVRSGWKLYIFRNKPAWCSGYLEAVELGEDEPIDMDYLIEEWGGQVLALKLTDEEGKFRGNATVKLNTYPIRFKGARLRRKDLMDEDYFEHRNNQKQSDQMALLQQQLDPRLAGQNQQEFLQMLKLMQSARKEDLGLLATLYQQHKPNGRQPNPMGEFMQWAGAFQQMKDMFREPGDGAPASVNEDTQILSTVSDLAKAYFSRGQQPKQMGGRQRGPRIAPPEKQQQRQQQQPIVQGDVLQSPHNGSEIDVTDVIANQTPEQAAQTMLTSLQKMPDDKKEKFFATVEKKTGLAFVDARFLEQEDDEGGNDHEEGSQNKDRPRRPPVDPHQV